MFKTRRIRRITKNRSRKHSYPDNLNKSWVVVQYDNRKIPAHYNKLRKINKEYCKKYRYDYIFVDKSYNLPPYWIKVHLCLDIMKTNKYCGIVWLDTDAVFFDCSRSLNEFTKDKTKHFFIGKDPVQWGGNIICNAGVWFVKNTTIGNSIMNDWVDLYKPEVWVKHGIKWSVKDNATKKEKQWAGLSYEQGTMDQILIPKYRRYIKIYPVYILAHWHPTKENNSFTAHFYTGLPQDAPAATKDFIKLFEENRIKC